MTISVFFSFFIYSFVTSVTPGPNNIMLAASGLNFGFIRSIPHILGIGFGFGFMVALIGVGIGSILINSENMFQTLKIVGIIYLLYLAYKIAISGKIEDDKSLSKPLGFIGAAIFQWVNPKAWIMTMGAITTYTSSDSNIYTFLFIGIIYGLVSIPSVGVWAYIGEKLTTIVKNEKSVKIFNVTMAALLLLSVATPVREVVEYYL